MTSQLNEFSAAETGLLIAELLHEIPRFINELPDKKVLDDIYGVIRSYEAEDGYRWHRFKQYLFRGAKPIVESSYEGIQFTEAKRYHAALMGMLCVMEEIFTTVCRVYHPEAKAYHYFGQPNEVGRRLERLAKEILYSRESGLGTDFTWDEIGELYEQNVDLFHFMVFVFRCLRDRGYDWLYRSDHLAFVRRLEEGRVGNLGENRDKEEDMDGEVGLEELGPNADQYKSSWADMTFESEYFKFVAEEPDTVIQAYIEVYGVEPAGYPPRMDEY